MKIETKDYTGFSAQKLLNDDFFIWSHKEKTPETENFWKELLHSGQLAPEADSLYLPLLEQKPYLKWGLADRPKSSTW